MRSKHLALLSLLILANAKALFYFSNERVSWFLFSTRERYLCNVIEDYSNRISFIVLFSFITFNKIDHKTKQISLFLLIISILDVIHLGFIDLQYLIILKLVLASVLFKICTILKVL